MIYYQCGKKYPCLRGMGFKYASCDDLNKFHVHIPILPLSSFKKKVPKQKKFTALHNKGIAKYLHKKICSVDLFFFNSDKNVWSSTYI